MALEQRIVSLQKQHDDLETEILAETARPQPDEFILVALKRRKLGIKDSITRLLSMQQDSGGYRQAA